MATPEYKHINYSDKCFKKLLSLRRSIFCGEVGEAPAFIKDKNDENGYHMGFFLGDALIGTGSIYPKRNGDFEIKYLCVNKDYRRFKIGTKLLNALKDYAIKTGAKQIICTSPVEALDFFHKNNIPHDGISFKKNNKRYIPLRLNLVFEGADWLSFGNEAQAVVASNEFSVKDIENTRLFVSGLGYCHIYINGKSVSNRLLAPAWTNYPGAFPPDELSYPIYDKMTHRILYETFDVTDFLKKGKNTITFHIGGGWYAQRECPNEGVKPFGNLTLCYKLLQGNKILSKSDKSVKHNKSYIKRANLYYAEEQDATSSGYDFSKKFDTTSWKNADIIATPLAVLDEQDFLPDKVIRTLKPKEIYKNGDTVIYDIGENISGTPVIKFNKAAEIGSTCTVSYAEVLNDDYTLNYRSTGGEGRIQKDTFIYDGKIKEMSLQFSWRAGRFMEVHGNAKVTEYRVIHTDIKPIVNYKSDNETLQWIFDAFMRTQMSNTHGCIPSDCPHRERLGYTGDGQLTADTVMLCFDAEKMYRKWMRDIADSQDIYNGHVQHTAPFYGGGGGPGGWGGAIVFVPYSFYKAYKDKSVLEKYYNNMLLYLDYMDNHSEKGLVVREEYLGWCLGDWCAPKRKNTIPEPFVNTYFLIRAYKQVIEISETLGKPVKELKARLKAVETAFKNKYYNKKTCTFGNSKQAMDAYGFDIGLGNKKTLKAIVDRYEKLGAFDTGIFGTRLLIKTLCENGYVELAKRILTNKTENSYYNMKKNGATTLWENWDGCASHSHPMFGSVIEYIVKYM